MRLLHFIRLTFFFLFSLLVFGCGGKKDSIGMDDEIRVVCSKIDEPIIKEYLAIVFNDTLYLSLIHI